MKSKKLGRKGLWYKIKDIGILLQRNFKIELNYYFMWYTLDDYFKELSQCSTIDRVLLL